MVGLRYVILVKNVNSENLFNVYFGLVPTSIFFMFHDLFFLSVLNKHHYCNFKKKLVEVSIRIQQNPSHQHDSMFPLLPCIHLYF